MKQRIKKMVIILLVFAGVLFVGSLIVYYLPLWVYYTIVVLILLWLMYDGSKPEKVKKHYWLYHSIILENGQITIGALENEKPTFSLSGSEFDIKKSLVFSAVEIDKETYDIINNAINGINKSKDD